MHAIVFELVDWNLFVQMITKLCSTEMLQNVSHFLSYSAS